MSLIEKLQAAARVLRRNPGYAVAFVVTLGLAMGANTAVFTVVNGVLLKSLPFENADRILYVQQPATRAGVPNMSFSFIEIDDYRASARLVDEIVEYGDWDFTVVGQGQPHRAVAGLVTANYFEVLGLSTAMGRPLLAEDDADGAEPVMVLTSAYWDRAFGRDPDVIGKLVSLSGIRTRVVGVLEPGFHYTGSRQQDFFANYATNAHYQGAAMRDSRGHRMTDIFARVAPGATLEAASAEFVRAGAAMRADHPEDYPAELGLELLVRPWRDELTRQARPIFLLLMGTVTAILLLACANITNLTLARLIRRENELATRGALGARPRDLRMELTMENVVLALLGCALALVLAWLSRGALVAYASRFTLRAQEISLDGSVLAFTLLAGCAVAVALAWLPGLPVAPGTSSVASAALRATGNRTRKHMQRGLVVAQLALSFALLAGSALLVRTLLNLLAVDPGFRTENVLTLEAVGGGVGSPVNNEALFTQVLATIRAQPGVRQAASAAWAPLTDPPSYTYDIRVPGNADGTTHSLRLAYNNVSDGYFEALDIGVLEGRTITAHDDSTSERVVVLGRSLARTLFPDGRALDRTIEVSFGGGQPRSARLVGVVEDTRDLGLETMDVHTLYAPARQGFWGATMVVATEGDPTALAEFITKTIHALDPDRPVDRIRTMRELRAADVAPSRLNATLFGSFAGLALLIAAVGVLGVLSFSVRQRTREFGIRMALGEQRLALLRRVLSEGMLMAVIALAVGGGVALLLGRLLSGMLFGVQPVDGPSLAVSAALLGTATVLAAYLPALRATRVDPQTALRAE